MPRNELNLLLADLQREITNLNDGQQDTREQLQNLANDLETYLSADEIHNAPQELAERLQENVEQFEVEHPTITGTLNSIMVTLSGMGI